MMTTLLALLVANPGPTKLAIDGDGYMRLSLDGRVVYARSVELRVIDGKLGNASGATFLPPIRVPSSGQFHVSLDGTVTLISGNNKQEIGQLVVAMFAHSASLVEKEGLFTSADRPKLFNPGDELAGVIRTVKPQVASASADKTSASTVKTPVSPPVAENKPSVSPGQKATPQVSPANTKPVVKIRPETSIDAPTFTLLDIAEVSASAAILEQLSQIPVGDTPPMGAERRIDRERIMIRLKVAGIDAKDWKFEIPQGAKVVKAGQVVSQTQFFELAADAIRKEYGNDLTITDQSNLSDLKLPMGDLKLIAKTPNVTKDQATVTIEVRIDGRIYNSRTLRLGVEGINPLPSVGANVAVRVVSKGITVQMSGKVSRHVGKTQIEIVTDQGSKLVGKPGPDGVVVIQL